MKGKYVYGFSDDDFMSDQFDTPEEALAAAREEAPEDSPFTEVYIGTVGKWEPEIDGESIIDMIQDEAYDVGGDHADGYLDGATKEQREELTEALTSAFRAWAAKHGHTPKFYPVENVKEYKL